MQSIQYPVQFQFKISTLANDFIAKDANDKVVAYVRQKMFKLKEDIVIYNNESKSEIQYSIKADRWLDFSAAYAFLDKDGSEFGKIVRKGWKSLWKTRYDILNEQKEIKYSISEENPWVKVLDSLLGEIPILSMFTGYLFNPSYILTDKDGCDVVKMRKMPSFFGRKFELAELGDLDTVDDDRILLGFMMMVLLERRKG